MDRIIPARVERVTLRKTKQCFHKSQHEAMFLKREN